MENSEGGMKVISWGGKKWFGEKDWVEIEKTEKEMGMEWEGINR